MFKRFEALACQKLRMSREKGTFKKLWHVHARRSFEPNPHVEAFQCQGGLARNAQNWQFCSFESRFWEPFRIRTGTGSRSSGLRTDWQFCSPSNKKLLGAPGIATGSILTTNKRTLRVADGAVKLPWHVAVRGAAWPRWKVRACGFVPLGHWGTGALVASCS